ncbi:MAG: hypothetical protein LC772_09250, partial [Chloroflexi bacterium]|nr:hypothetical protein [Chloroflexota bacterium]
MTVRLQRTHSVLLEDDSTADLPAGVIAVVRGRAGTADRVNGNRRLYPAGVYRRVVRQFNREHEDLLGELDHPGFGEGPRLEKTAFRITRLQVTEGRHLDFTAHVLDTPHGHTLKSLLASGIPVNVSTRGAGTLSRCCALPDDADPAQAAHADHPHWRVDDDYELHGIDAVVRAAHAGAVMGVRTNSEGAQDARGIASGEAGRIAAAEHEEDERSDSMELIETPGAGNEPAIRIAELEGRLREARSDLEVLQAAAAAGQETLREALEEAASAGNAQLASLEARLAAAIAERDEAVVALNRQHMETQVNTLLHSLRPDVRQKVAEQLRACETPEQVTERWTAIEQVLSAAGLAFDQPPGSGRVHTGEDSPGAGGAMHTLGLPGLCADRAGGGGHSRPAGAGVGDGADPGGGKHGDFAQQRSAEEGMGYRPGSRAVSPAEPHGGFGPGGRPPDGGSTGGSPYDHAVRSRVAADSRRRHWQTGRAPLARPGQAYFDRKGITVQIASQAAPPNHSYRAEGQEMAARALAEQGARDGRWSYLMEGIKDRRQRALVAQLLDNQVRAGLYEDDTTADIPTFTTIALAFIPKVYPALLINQIASVQPMAGPTAKVFFEDFVPDASPTSTFTHGESAALAAPSGAPSPSASGTGSGFVAGQYSVAQSYTNAVGETTVGPSATVTLTAGQNIVVAANTLPTGASGTNYYVSIAPGSSVLGKAASSSSGAQQTITAPPTVYGTPASNSTSQQVSEGGLIPKTRYKLTSSTVTAQKYALQVQWTTELQEDLRAQYNQDLQSKVFDYVARELTGNIDYTALNTIFS